MKNFEHYFIEIPVPMKSKIYKVCPSYHEKQQGDCKNCGWNGCSFSCDVYPFQSKACIHETTLEFCRLESVLKYWNKMFFKDKEYAQRLVKHYNEMVETCKKQNEHFPNFINFVEDCGAYYK